MLCRRTTEMMVAKAPTRKIPTRAIFSFLGRLMLRSVLIGRARIQMSVRMLKLEVTAAVSLLVMRPPVFLFGRLGHGAAVVRTYSRKTRWC